MSNEDRQGIIIIVALILALVCMLIINTYTLNEIKKQYEFALNGEIYQSDKCFQKENGNAYCKVGNMNVRVDNYYEID